MLFMEDDALADAIIARFNAGSACACWWSRAQRDDTQELVILDRLEGGGDPDGAPRRGRHPALEVHDLRRAERGPVERRELLRLLFQADRPVLQLHDEGIFFTDQPSWSTASGGSSTTRGSNPAAFFDFGNIAAPPARRYRCTRSIRT
jgi:hypothetical protein